MYDITGPFLQPLGTGEKRRRRWLGKKKGKKFQEFHNKAVFFPFRKRS